MTMPRKRSKARSPSLRERKAVGPAPTVTLPRALFERFLAMKKTACEMVDLDLWYAEQFATECERNGLCDEATRLRAVVSRLVLARQSGDIDAAIVEARALGSLAVHVRMDAAFAGAVDAYVTSRRKPSVTDAQIRDAIAEHPKRIDAAAKLGIEPRTLRGRLDRMGGEKRKSVRSPPAE